MKPKHQPKCACGEPAEFGPFDRGIPTVCALCHEMDEVRRNNIPVPRHWFAARLKLRLEPLESLKI